MSEDRVILVALFTPFYCLLDCIGSPVSQENFLHSFAFVKRLHPFLSEASDFYIRLSGNRVQGGEACFMGD